jgi:DNA repair protein RadC
MSITNWPLSERPREKLLARGASHLSDAELLAIFLRIGIKGKSALDLARDLLSAYGSIRALLKADLEDFCTQPGMGSAKYAQLQACMELANRCLGETLVSTDLLNNRLKTENFLIHKLRDRTQEVFACLFLDSKNYLLAYKELFVGTINSSVVYPREVVQEALKQNAVSVIFAHNHPSGDSTPSRADKAITLKLREALNLVDIRVCDHFIIGNGEITSFAEKSLL